MKLEIVERPALRVGAVPHTGPYDQIPEAFARLGDVVGRDPELANHAPPMIAIYHDDPDKTPPERLRSDAGLVVPEGAALPPGLEERRVRGGRYARVLHVGPYEQLPDAWARLKSAALPDGQRHADAASYEIYLNTPGDVPEEDLRTELYEPVA
jgi:AraC family transcriptional regulator